MSTMPIAQPPHHAPAYLHALPVLPPPKRPRSKGHPYVPGMFDPLIDKPVCGPTAPTHPAKLRGVTIELAASGRSVMLAEVLHPGAGGTGQRHLLTLDEPYSVFLKLADGREVWIEVRAVDEAPEEDREPWGEGGNGGNDEPAELLAAPSTFSCPDFAPRS